MTGCFGNHPEDKAMSNELHSHLKQRYKGTYLEGDDAREQRIEDRARDMFLALPDFYTRRDDQHKFTNMDDCIGYLKQEELISIARALRDGDNKLAGDLLASALMRICINNAEDEISDEEFKDE